MKSYSSREIIRALEDDGWKEVSCVGDHQSVQAFDKIWKSNRDSPC